MEYTYNANGDKTSVTVKSGGTNKFQTVYAYFKNGWLKQVKGQKWVSGAWSDMTRSDFAYDAAGNWARRRNGLSLDDIRSEYAYNSRGELKRIQHFDPSNAEQYGITYKRDGAGNPLAVDFVGLNCPSVYKDKMVSYAYDAISRLASQTVGNGTPTSWDYDWVGNRGTSSDFNALDEYMAGNGRVYDMRGNLAHIPDASSSTRTDYSYTSDNLLSEVSVVNGENTTTTAMTWDADGRRVKVDKGDSFWYYLYDPVTSNGGVILSTDNLSEDVTYYVREPDGELLSSYYYCGWGNVTNFHYDAAGSAVLLSDNTGGILDSSTYTAWGEDAESINALKPYRFIGRLGYYTHDSASMGDGVDGLIQLGTRFYQPECGRFTQRDAAKDGINFYAYCLNNPLNSVDPSGNACTLIGSRLSPAINPRTLVGTHQLDYYLQVGSDMVEDVANCKCIAKIATWVYYEYKVTTDYVDTYSCYDCSKNPPRHYNETRTRSVSGTYYVDGGSQATLSGTREFVGRPMGDGTCMCAGVYRGNEHPTIPGARRR